MAFVFEDPVTLEVMKDAVVTQCGHSFSQSTIEEWLETKQTCPLCASHLTLDDVKPNYSLRDAITHYLNQNQHPETTTTTSSSSSSSITTETSFTQPTTLSASFSSSASTIPKGVTIKEIHPSDGENAASVLEQSFRTDPFVQYFYPSGGSNAVYGMKWFLSCMINYGVRKGRVWGAYHIAGSPPSRIPVSNLTSSFTETNSKTRLSLAPQEICGTAIWQPPFESGVSFWEMIKSGMVSAPYHMGLRTSWRVVATLDALEKKHRQSISGPHWSLYSIGIIPSLQNMGIGTNLVLPILKAADAEQMPIYVDTPSSRSLRFFGRLGFQVVNESTENKMPPFWCLVRQPVPPPS